ncbi:hypothetical protein [Janthinobacterium fluminis]|uniref:Lipoprotein n=1 Tax=Janthinobacterium fluminis TaxID=2987524 RepID=A0ABT5JX86_9BURK|nr:hypothetical protein [Janthinobacterium fluminis]MDC8757358.1 hypothetical protein [Janthinobacterium fluminis]
MGTKSYTVLAGLMCAALGACSSTDERIGATGEPYGSSMAGSSYQASGTSAADTSQASTMSMQGVVQSIESIPRAQAGSMDSSGSTSQSGTSGTLGGAGSSADVAYRVTLRLDDGSSKVITQQSQPAFQIGDRVRVANGIIQRY